MSIFNKSFIAILVAIVAYFIYLKYTIGNINIKDDIYQFKLKDIQNQTVDMKEFKDKVILIVNVASDCGFTNQYEGLQKLYQQYQDKGLRILAFPSDQFDQERDTEEEILDFVQNTYKVTFKLMKKVKLNGDDAEPLYQYLKVKKPGLLGIQKIKWNFEKFLISRDGIVINRYSSMMNPSNLEDDIIRLLD